MFMENTRYGRRKQKPRWNDFEEAELDEDLPERATRLRAKTRPGAKRTLHYITRLWETAGEECLQLLEGELDGRVQSRALKGR